MINPHARPATLAAPPGAAWLLAGATATGKSAVAQWIAERQDAAILSADAMLVYRGMDVGTAKPTPAERGAVPYLGLDCVAPDQPFSVGDWLAHVERGLATLDPARPLIVAGGTGLYFRALLHGLDGDPADPARRRHWQGLFEHQGLPGLWQSLADLGADALLAPGDRGNPRRCIRALERAERLRAAGRAATPETGRGRHASSSPAIAALCMPRGQLHARIERRARRMLDAGLVEEAVALRARGNLSETAMQAIGYAEALALADGRLTVEAALARIAARTRPLAKRQMTWFRHQLAVHWIEIADDMSVEQVAGLVLEVWRQHGPAPLAQGRRGITGTVFGDAHS